jgi:hypothetical protein
MVLETLPHRDEKRADSDDVHSVRTFLPEVAHACMTPSGHVRVFTKARLKHQADHAGRRHEAPEARKKA